MVSTDLSSGHAAPAGSLVLLRGLARQAAHWGDLPTQLAQSLNMPVYCPDLPGMGEASVQTPACSIPLQTLQLLPRLLGHIPAPWHLVGMSLGGMVALELARQQSAQVASVVLINSSVASLSPFYQRLQWPMYPKVLACLLASAATREALILQMTSAYSASEPHPALAQWQGIARRQPVSTVNALRQLWAASRYQLQGVPECAGLVITSAADQLVSPRCSEALSHALGWPLRRHPSAGHDIALDDPRWLYQQLQDFYQTLSSK